VKIRTKNETARAEVVSYVNIFRGRIVDVSKNSVIVEITGDSSKIEAFVNLVSSFGVRELARTGVTAMSRGAGK
jgi:acetolactate synthase-1/3 small subunit